MPNLINAKFMAAAILKWSIRRIMNSFIVNREPIHIIFALVDHYEPGTGSVSMEVEIARVEELLDKYPRIADKHRDSDGRIPRRTWFYPPHYHRFGNLRKLVSLCEKGYGEIELHLHHGNHRPDNSQNLEDTIKRIIAEYSEFGIFGEEGSEKKYAFIHGNWALDNSRGGKFCGVNNEIDVLRRTGCFADFTHPSLAETTPKQINSIYYAVGQHGQCKSYEKGRTVTGGEPGEGLMIVQGPLYPYLRESSFFSLRAVGDAVCGIPFATKRIDRWVKTGIHVLGKQNFIFVKTYTHGAVDAPDVLGNYMEQTFNYMEQEYGDSDAYRLHYVTAREMYNIIRAIESDPNIEDPYGFINYKIQPPVYNSQCCIEEASHELQSLIGKTYW